MAKSSAIILFSALCFLSLFDFALSESENDRYFVEGKVYCDTCRIQFFTRVSKFIGGATVKLECKEREDGGAVTFSKEALTDKSGGYSIAVEGDHEEEVCEVTLEKSGEVECSEIPTDGYGHRARVSITGNNGITTPVRQASPLGFMQKETLTQCKEVLRELGFDEAGIPV